MRSPQISTGSSRVQFAHLSVTSGNNNETGRGRGGNFLFIFRHDGDASSKGYSFCHSLLTCAISFKKDTQTIKTPWS
jgi:hypothetical protein